MEAQEIIRNLIEKNNYSSYLEIGSCDNYTFNKVQNVKIKDSVDPNGRAMYNMTSDQYFANYCKNKYDIIFIDGLHLAEQVLKDVYNSLAVLNDNGILVLHDCLPESEKNQTRELILGTAWTGDVWKAVADLRYRNDLKICVVNTDWGCGLIQKAQSYNQPKIYKPLDGWNWNDFVLYRDDLLNVISVKEFISNFLN